MANDYIYAEEIDFDISGQVDAHAAWTNELIRNPRSRMLYFRRSQYILRMNYRQ